MSERRIVSYPLEELFSFKRGNSIYTKKYCHQHRGKYEVYTGTTIGSFASIDTYEYTEPHLTYTTDGEYAGTVTVINDDKYNVGGHRAILVAKSSELNLKYFKYILDAMLRSKVKDGSVPSVTWTNIKKLLIPVPVNSEGRYSLDEQIRIAERYEILALRRRNLEKIMIELSESYITISADESGYKEVSLNKLFDYKRGGSCTRAFCNLHKGKYPVWSANNVKPLAYVDFYDYDGKYISLSRNGIAGKITILEGKFCINEDRFLLVPKVGNIDYDFIKYTIEPILRGKKKGRAGHNGQNEFTKLSYFILDNIKIKMPILESGDYDLEKQIEISLKYNKLYEMKLGIYNIINKLVSTEILMDE